MDRDNIENRIKPNETSKYVDMHLHTHLSDGSLSPMQIVRMAKTKGLDMIAITDHDTTVGYFKAVNEAKRVGIEIVPGVEISTIDHHLVGLNFDPYDNRFNDFINYSRLIQQDVTSARVDILADYGIPISMSKVRENFPNCDSGTYNVARTIFFDPDCRRYLNTKLGKGFSVRDIFQTYLSGDGIAANVDTGAHITWQQSINAIHTAGGLTVFAHPSTVSKDPEKILDKFDGIDGLEVLPKFKGGNDPYIKLANERNLIITYSSDFHDPATGSVMLGRGENYIDASILGEIKK